MRNDSKRCYRSPHVLIFLLIFVLGGRCGFAQGLGGDVNDKGKVNVGEMGMGEFLNKVEHTKEQLKQQEERAALAKQEVEKIRLEKESLEQEALAKKYEVDQIQQQAQDLRNNQAAKERIKQVTGQALELKSEADLLHERIAVMESKMAAAEEKAAVRDGAVLQTKEHLADLWKTWGENRSLARKIIVSFVILLVGIIFFFLLRFGIRKFEAIITREDVLRESERTLQLKTFGKLLDWLAGIIVVILVIYAILGNFGVDASILIAGAGIAGIALGFGAQYLVRDIISGIFILLEGQYRLNDVVKIGEDSGLVENINLRITTLRDLEGRVIIIPNGEITRVINYTKDFAYAMFDFGVAYKENVDDVMALIKQIGKELNEDEYFQRLILADLEMFGVNDFADSQVTIKFRIKTIPIKQWEVAREFRRRLKNRFDELNIEIPFPHRTLYIGTGKDNEWLKSYAFGQPKSGQQ